MKTNPKLFIAALGMASLLACLSNNGPAEANPSTLGPGVNSNGGGSSARTVTVGDNFFSPASISIPANDTVTWVWAGTNQHTVTFADGITSGVQTTGSMQRFFATPGTFVYFDQIYGDSGSVVVQ